MKKRFVKRWAALALTGVLAAGLLAGCGSTEEQTAGSADTAEAEAEEDEDTDYSDYDEADIVTLSVSLCSVGDKAGSDEVIDRINEIARAEAGVEIDVEWIDIGSWVQQIGLKMSSSEPTDIIMATPLMTLSTLLAQNEVLDMSEYLEEYGQDILSVVPEAYLEAATTDSGTYAIPMVMSKQDSIYIIMRTDVLDELGLTEQAEAMSSWSELEEILETVKENTDYVPLHCATTLNIGVTFPDYVDLSADDWSENHGIDNLGDSYGLIYVDEDTDTVCSYYQSDIFKTDIARAADFYSKGYLYMDGATSDMDYYEAVGNGNCFACIVGTSDLGAEQQCELQCGIDVTVVPIASESITTHLIDMWSYVIPYTCSEPEAAMRFLNLLYSNEEVANLFTWGIEGRDYTLNDNGTVTLLDDAEYSSQSWLHGNTLLTYPSDANGPDYQEQAKEIIDNQEYSKYLGFLCDTTEITNELSACYTAMQEYSYSLLSGSVSNYEQVYEEFSEKLDSSGMDAILECYQEQLDAWLAEQ